MKTTMAIGATVIMRGRLGTNPQSFNAGKSQGCSFRLAVPRGFYDKDEKLWRESSTLWITVKAFRHLASNILQSLHKGQPVLVAGQIIGEEWEKDGKNNYMVTLHAESVGHDLVVGKSEFTSRNNGKNSTDNPSQSLHNNELGLENEGFYLQSGDKTEENSQKSLTSDKVAETKLSLEVHDKQDHALSSLEPVPNEISSKAKARKKKSTSEIKEVFKEIGV